MAYYDALIAKWATLTPGTTAAKLAQINAITIQIATQGNAMLTSSQIKNAIVPADFGTLTQLQVSLLTLLLADTPVDASKGSSIRAAIQTIFSGKTTTLNNLLALVAPFDAPLTIPWWRATVAQGGGELREPVGRGDLINAGNLT